MMQGTIMCCYGDCAVYLYDVLRPTRVYYYTYKLYGYVLINIDSCT